MQRLRAKSFFALILIFLYLKLLSQVEAQYTQSISMIQIGDQIWMKENLDVSTYRNGDSIPECRDSVAWSKLTTGAWCYYENNREIGKKYGKLYNWYAVNDPRGLAPVGWHVPSFEEWTLLIDVVGSNKGTKLIAIDEWPRLINANNSTGFTGLPAGNRNHTGDFDLMGHRGWCWSISADESFAAWRSAFAFDIVGTSINSRYKNNGFSVRCLKD